MSASSMPPEQEEAAAPATAEASAPSASVVGDGSDTAPATGDTAPAGEGDAPGDGESAAGAEEVAPSESSALPPADEQPPAPGEEEVEQPLDYEAVAGTGLEVQSWNDLNDTRSSVAGVLTPQLLCSGVLVHQQWVLTAKRCLADSAASPQAGPKWRTNQVRVSFAAKLGTGQQPEYYAVKRQVLAPYADLALIELARPNNWNRVAAIEPQVQTLYRRVRAVGYGKQSDKQQHFERNFTDKWPAGRVPYHSFCGQRSLALQGGAQVRPGDVGAGVFNDSGKLVGLRNINQWHTYYNPRTGKHYTPRSPRSSVHVAEDYAVDGSVIAGFVSQHTPVRVAGGHVPTSCGKPEQPVTAALVYSNARELRNAWVENNRVVDPQLAEVIGRQRSHDRAVLGVFRVCYRDTGCLNQYREIWLPPGWQVQEFHRPFDSETLFEATAFGRSDPGNGLKTGDFRTTRVAGRDRVATSLRTLTVDDPQNFRPTHTVVLVSGTQYADAIVAAPLARAYNGGIVVTVSGRGLEASILQTLSQERTREVIIVGGTGAVSPQKERQLVQRGLKVRRIAGTNRFLTSEYVARELITKGYKRHAFFADGTQYPDALTAGAAAAEQRGFVLLTRGRHVMNSTFALGQEANGQSAVGMQAHLATYGRLSDSPAFGSNRYATSTLVGQAFGGVRAVQVVASGSDYPDALAAGAFTAKHGGRLQLIPPRGQHEGARAGGRDWNATDVYIVGGPGTLPDTQVSMHVR